MFARFIAESISSLRMGRVMTDAWKDEEDGPKWVPILNEAEVAFGIPTDLLARIAYQESSFIPGQIDGTIASSVGALGLMQLMPQFFDSVKVPRPFTDADTNAQIKQSATLLVSLYHRFGDWQVAVAAYNWGGGNVHADYIKDGDEYVLSDMPSQTQNYVKKVFGDVPIAGALLA